MRILYYDIISPKGHRNFNAQFIRLLSRIAEIDVAIKDGYLDEINVSNSIKNILPIPTKLFVDETLSKKITSKSKFLYRIKLILNFILTYRKIDFKTYDAIFFGSYETTSFSFLSWFISNRCFVINHNNISEIQSIKSKCCFYKKINPKIEHIVFEDYIKDYLVSEIKIKNRIWVIHHPLIDFNNKILNCRGSKRIIFAPSNSNDEEFIRYVKSNEDKINSEYEIIIKSKVLDYLSTKLQIYNNWISEEDYNYYMTTCSYVLISFEKSFNYRVSSLLLEALKRGKRIILFCNNTLKYYSQKYPDSFLTFYRNVEFFEILDNNLNYYVQVNNSAIADYSDDRILQMIKSIFDGEPL